MYPLYNKGYGDYLVQQGKDLCLYNTFNGDELTDCVYTSVQWTTYFKDEHELAIFMCECDVNWVDKSVPIVYTKKTTICFDGVNSHPHKLRVVKVPNQGIMIIDINTMTYMLAACDTTNLRIFGNRCEQDGRVFVFLANSPNHIVYQETLKTQLLFINFDLQTQNITIKHNRYLINWIKPYYPNESWFDNPIDEFSLILALMQGAEPSFERGNIVPGILSVDLITPRFGLTMKFTVIKFTVAQR